MGHDDVYLQSGRLESKRKMEKDLLRICLDTSGMSVKQRIKHYLSLETWKLKGNYLNYLVKDVIDYFKK